MPPVAKRKPLSSHQREVLTRLARLSGGPEAAHPFKWVALENIGSRTACEHLVRKGYAESRVERGPRGGKRAFYRPATESPVVRSRFASLDERRA